MKVNVVFSFIHMTDKSNNDVPVWFPQGTMSQSFEMETDIEQILNNLKRFNFIVMNKIGNELVDITNTYGNNFNRYEYIDHRLFECVPESGVFFYFPLECSLAGLT